MTIRYLKDFQSRQPVFDLLIVETLLRGLPANVATWVRQQCDGDPECACEDPLKYYLDRGWEPSIKKRSRGDDDRRKGADIRDRQRTHMYSRIKSTPMTESKSSSREEFQDKDGRIKPKVLSDQGLMCALSVEDGDIKVKNVQRK